MAQIIQVAPGKRRINRQARLLLIHPSTRTNDWFGKKGNQVEITGLRIQAEIKHNLSKHPNSADITITNLNKNSRSEFSQKPLIVSLDAGYDGDLQQVFTGDLRYGHSTLKTPDWETKLQIADGDRAFRQARVNQSFAAKTPILSILEHVSGQMGLTLPSDMAQNGILPYLQTQIQSGTVLTGTAQEQLTKLLDRFDCHWSIQNSKLLIQRDVGNTPGLAQVISSATGLKGSVEVGVPDREGTKRGNQVTAKWKMTLNPELYPGSLVSIDSRETKGIFKLKSVSHNIDTHGDPWDTSCEAIAT